MKTRQLLMSLGLVVGLTATAAQATIVAVDMVPGGAVDAALMKVPGDTFDVDVLIGDVLGLGGFQFDLGFDSSVLMATSITDGGLFGADSIGSISSILLDSISFADATLDLNGLDIPLSSLLATIHFKVVGEGVSALFLSNVLLADPIGDPIDTATSDGELTSALPLPPPVGVVEPATLALLGAGLAALLLRRRVTSFLPAGGAPAAA